MANGIRFVGMSSGIDTQSIVEAMLTQYQSRIDKINGNKTKTEWKKDAYKEMSSKLTTFRTKTLNSIKRSGMSAQVNTSYSQSGIIKVAENQNGKAGNFKVKVDQVATASRVQTNQLAAKPGTVGVVNTRAIEAAPPADGGEVKKLSGSSKMSEIKDMPATGQITINGVTIDFNEETTIGQFEGLVNQKLAEASQDVSFKFNTSTSTFEIKTNGRGSSETINIAGNASVIDAMGIQANPATGGYSYAGTDTGEYKLTRSSRISDIAGMGNSGSIKINGIEMTYDKTTTIDEFQSQVMRKLKDNGSDINFTFDEANSMFHIYSKKTGVTDSTNAENDKNSILIENSALAANLGIAHSELGVRHQGQNAKIKYNGYLDLESQTNDMEVDGVKFTVLEQSTSDVSVHVTRNIDKVVESVKTFLEEYNKLMDEMTTKYEADSASKYEMLTDKKKEAMKEKEVENWENKIKDSLLRRDSTLSDLTSLLRTTMTDSYKGQPGIDDKYNMLSQIGIGAKSWTEKGKLSIQDESTLRNALENDFDSVVNLLDTIANKLDKELYTRSKSTNERSYGQFFNDKILTRDMSQYAKDLITAQAKYDKMETYYYKKFTAMETAMNKINSQSSLFSSL